MSCVSSRSVAQDRGHGTHEIEVSVTQLYAAMIEKNKSVLQNLTMDKLTYGHSSGKVEDKSEYVDGVLNGAFQFSSITPTDQTISVVGDVGIVRHIFKAEGTNDSTPAKVNIGCLMVFQKQNNSWKLLARQAFKI